MKKEILQKIKNVIISATFAVIIGIVPMMNIFAAGTGGIVPCTDDCTAEQLMGKFDDPIWAQIIRAMLGVAGSFILLSFVIGGFMFIISRGDKALINKGKTMMISSIVGILIVAFAYLGVRLIVSFFAGDNYAIFFGQGSLK